MISTHSTQREGRASLPLFCLLLAAAMSPALSFAQAAPAADPAVVPAAPAPSPAPVAAVAAKDNVLTVSSGRGYIA